nr:hypothetical protein [Tanacetum cinerariifolium]
MAFVSSLNNNTSSTNGIVNTAHRVSIASTQVNAAYSTNIDNLSDAIIYSFFASQPNSHQLVHDDLKKIHPYDMEEMDMRWQMAMLTMRARRFLKKTRRKLSVNVNETIGFDKSNVECYNCHKRRHFARECRALRNQDNKHKESSRKSVHVETSASTTLVSCDGLSGYDWSDQAEEGPNYELMAFSSLSSNSEVSSDSTCLKSCLEMVKHLKSRNDQLLKDLKKFELMVLGEIATRELRKKLEIAQKEKDDIQLNVDKFEHASKSLNKLIDCQIVDNCKKWLGYENYNVVPPPYTGNFMPPTPNLSFTGLDKFVNKPVVENCKAKSSKEETRVVRKNDDSLIIEEWVSGNGEEDVSQPKVERKTVRPSIAKIEKPKRKDTQVPQPSGPTESVTDEAVHKELGDSLVRAATTASSLEAEYQETIGDTTAQTRVLDLEQTKATQKNEIDSLKKMNPLEIKKVWVRMHLNRRGGLNVIDVDADDEITLVNDVDNEMFDVDDISGEKVFVAGQNDNVVKEVVNVAQVSTAATVTITTKEITLAQALEALKTSKPKVKGTVFQEPGKSTTTTPKISLQKSQDKGKGIMIEEPVKPKKKDQIRLDEEAALKLQVEFDEEEILARERELKKNKKPILP